MSRFQEAFSSLSRIFTKEKCVSCENKIKNFDLAGPFVKYSREIRTIDSDVAKQKLRSLLDLNMRTYVQEAVGESQITQIATAVKNVLGEHFFQDSFYDDVEAGWIDSIKNASSKKIADRYRLELTSWRLVWNQHLAQIDDLAGLLPEKIPAELVKKGFSHLSGSKGLLVGKSLSALYPSLKENDRVEAYRSEQALLVASPNFEHYHKGQTTIARYSKIYYLPTINKFVILEDGLFTAYSNDQIKEFLKLDKEKKELPKTTEEFFQFIAVLSKELSALPPHAVFQMVMDQIGEFPKIPTGMNVNTQSERSYQTQLELIERMFDLEIEWHKEFPLMASRVEQRFALMTEVIEHSLLRANDLAVEDLMISYQNMFAPNVSQKPEAGGQKHYVKASQDREREFRVNMIKIYPDFATRVQSLIDCGSGGILGGVQNLSSFQLPSALGFDRWNIISTLTGKNIVNRAQFEDIAKKLGKNPKDFDHLGHCQMCGAHTFLGGCNVCVLCEYKDDLGITADQLGGFRLNFENNKLVSRKGYLWGGPQGFSEFVATMV